MEMREAKEEAKMQGLHFSQWAMANIIKGMRVLVLYEDPLSADLEGQVYQGRVVAVGPYWPPSMLIKFALKLQPGDAGGEYCTHSLEFKSCLTHGQSAQNCNHDVIFYYLPNTSERDHWPETQKMLKALGLKGIKGVGDGLYSQVLNIENLLCTSPRCNSCHGLTTDLFKRHKL
jgi:hypothetical protein